MKPTQSAVINSLENRRKESATAGRGISSDLIYQLTLRLSRALPPGGDLLEYGAGIGSLIREFKGLNYLGKITATHILTRPG
jgi:hypothetical protein